MGVCRCDLKCLDCTRLCFSFEFKKKEINLKIFIIKMTQKLKYLLP